MMNVEKLAEQSREFATTRHPISKIVLNVDSYVAQQKFVELIVKECAKVAKDTQDWYATNNPSGIVNTDISAKIEAHFGVK